MSENPKKIVFIDDDKFLLDMYVTKFKKSGFDVISFSSAQGVLDKLKEETDIDAVVFDIIMPGMDGWTFATEYRKLNILPDAKLIVLSNQNQSNDIQKSKDLNVDLFIVKALKTPSEVVTEINQII